MAIEDEEGESQQPLKKIKTFYSHHSIPTLPKEIVIEIIFRLPVKCILQCNPISCSLYDVMHDKSFKFVELDYPLKSSQNFVRIIGSCNGLLLLNVGNDALFISNPTTRTSNRLPYFGFKAGFYGFGYDASSEDYKVVVISDFNNKAKMYSLKSAKWKKIGDFPHGQGTGSFSDCGVFSNGALHWVVRSEFNSVWSPRIISLDLATEAYGEVLQPVNDEGLISWLWENGCFWFVLFLGIVQMFG